jgi:hypothetical protein
MSTVSPVLAIALPWVNIIFMCHFTALPPHRPANPRHQCGTSAALQRSRTAPPAHPQRTKASQIRYLCASHCGILSGPGTGWWRFCSLFAMKSLQNRAVHQENLIICATWVMPNFFIPKFYPGLPFSPPAPSRPPFSSQLHLGNAGKQCLTRTLLNLKATGCFITTNSLAPEILSPPLKKGDLGRFEEVRKIPPPFSKAAARRAVLGPRGPVLLPAPASKQ